MLWLNIYKLYNSTKEIALWEPQKIPKNHIFVMSFSCLSVNPSNSWNSKFRYLVLQAPNSPFSYQTRNFLTIQTHPRMHNRHPVTMEITVLSAEGLKAASSTTIFSHRLRPFITFSMTPPSPYFLTNADKSCDVYKTRVDDQGGTNPTWGDKFRLPIDSSFFTNRYSGIYLQLYTKRLILGQAQLGWCHIPAHDIGLPSTGTVRHLSYRLRARDGSRTRGIINLAVSLEGLEPVGDHGLSNSVSPTLSTCQTVIGIPVRPFPAVNRFSSTCHEQLGISCGRG